MVVHNNLDHKGQFVVVVVDKLPFVFEELVVKLPRFVMVTMLDILAHIAGDDQINGGDDVVSDLDKKMSVPVSAIIGRCLEGLSLWTLNPNTR